MEVEKIEDATSAEIARILFIGEVMAMGSPFGTPV
tara:strand:- start:8 stop:112 length:105 start_codon:yes stop_codon:yes gene_type:complete